MEFSRSVERDMELVSISCLSSTSPQPSSLPPYSPTAEEAMVDADAIERWLMSPAKSESTNAHTVKTSHAQNLSIQRLADVAIRRRSQHMQQQHQLSPPRSSEQERQNDTLRVAKISSRTTFRRSESKKKWQHSKEKNHSLSPTPVVTNINVYKKPELYHQTAAMTTDTTEKSNRRSSHAAKFAATENSIPNKISKATEKGKDRSKISFQDDSHYHGYDTIHDTLALPAVVSVESEEKISECDPSRDIDNNLNSYHCPIDLVATMQMTMTTANTTPIVVTKVGKDHEKKNSDKVGRSVTTSRGIAAIRRRRQQRLKRLELQKERDELEKEHQQDQSTKTAKAIAVVGDTQQSVNDSAIVQSSQSFQALKLQPHATTNDSPISPLGSNHQIHETDLRNDGTENRNNDNYNAHDHTNAMCVDNNMIGHIKGNSDANDSLVFPVSRTKNIQLLKRHDAGRGGSPLSKIPGISAREVRGNYIDLTLPLQNDTKQVTIYSNENYVSTIDCLRIIRRQTPGGGDSSSHEHEQGSLSPAADNPYIASPSVGKWHPSRRQQEEREEKHSFQNLYRQLEQQQQELQTHPKMNPQGSLLDYDYCPSTFHGNQNQRLQNKPYDDKNQYSIPSKSNKTMSDNIPSNIHNARQIKKALAHSIIKRDTDRNDTDNDPRRRSAGSSNGMSLKNRLQSRSSPCASVITTGLSTIGVDSSYSSNIGKTIKDESTADDDDDEVTTIPSARGTINGDEIDGEEVFQLSVPTELKTSSVKMTEIPFQASSPRDSSTIFAAQADTSMSMNHGNIAPNLIQDDNLTPLVDNYDVSIALGESNQNLKPLDTSICGNDIGKSTIGTQVEASVGASSVLNRKPHDRQQQQMQIRRKTSRIKLHVYDLVADDTQLEVWGCHFPLGQVFNAFNSSLHSIGTGAYHVGLEINGIEYAYGANSTKGLTGVFNCIPKSSPGYQFRTTIDFGHRMVMKKSNAASRKNKDAVDGRVIVRQMTNEYLGTDYDLLRKNCCTFAHDACIRLGISEQEIPSWFHNLAAVGAVTQDAANYTLAPITQLFSGNELEKFTDYLNESSLNDKLEAIIDQPLEVQRSDEYIADTAYQF